MVRRVLLAIQARSSSQTGGSVRRRQPACQRGAWPSGLTAVAAKQSAESLINDNLAFGWRITWPRLDQVVVQRLVRAILVIVVDKRAEGAPQVLLAGGSRSALIAMLILVPPQFVSVLLDPDYGRRCIEI